MLVAAPAFVLLGALAISETLDKAAQDLRTPEEDDAAGGGGGGGGGPRGSEGGGGGGGGKKKLPKWAPWLRAQGRLGPPSWAVARQGGRAPCAARDRGLLGPLAALRRGRHVLSHGAAARHVRSPLAGGGIPSILTAAGRGPSRGAVHFLHPHPKTHTHTCSHARTHKVRTSTHTRTRARTHARARAHTHTHTRTHTHTHARARAHKLTRHSHAHITTGAHAPRPNHNPSISPTPHPQTPQARAAGHVDAVAPRVRRPHHGGGGHKPHILRAALQMGARGRVRWPDLGRALRASGRLSKQSTHARNTRTRTRFRKQTHSS
jgi:hypothetical protein